MNMRFRKRKKVLIFSLLIFPLILILIILFKWKDIISFLHILYLDEVLVKWAGVIVNITIILLTLFLNITLGYFRRPRFKIDCDIGPPWQIQTKLAAANDDKDDVIQMHLRFRVTNVGRTCEDSSEVRIEKIYKINAQSIDKPIALNDHDPRPLKWVGRNTAPIVLNVDTYDFVDLGVRRSDILERFRLDFSERGHYDLIMESDIISGFLVDGTVYGNKAIPLHFTFELTWDPTSDFGPIKIKKI